MNLLAGCGGGCGCHDCGEGSGLAGLFEAGRRVLVNGLAGLMGALYPGSRIRVGFEFDYSHAYDPDEISNQIASYIQGPLYNFLSDGVTFTDVNVAVQAPGIIASGYITVSATTRVQLPSANAFGDMVQYAIEQYLPRILWSRRDETLVDYVAPGNVNRPGVEQAGPAKTCSLDVMSYSEYYDCMVGRGKYAPRTTTTTGTGNQLPPAPPGECEWSSMSFGDYVACQLGIKSAIGGVAAGATGALVGVGLIALAGVLILRR